jgi:hypothetical protein
VSKEAKALLREVTRFYLDSGDFNGIPALQLANRLKKRWEGVSPVVRALIEAELVGVLDTNSDVNPAIIRVGFEPKEVQIQKLDNSDLRHTYIYPRTAHLKSVVDSSDYIDRPYVLEIGAWPPTALISLL